MTGDSLAMHPYLIVRGAKEALDFYAQAFGGRVDFALTDPGDGRIGHAEVVFGSSRLYVADEYPDFGAVGPERLGGSPVKLHLAVTDCDAVVARATKAGATVLRAARVEFHGHRTALLADPFGYQWFIAQQVEDVSPALMQQRWQAMMSGGGEGSSASGDSGGGDGGGD